MSIAMCSWKLSCEYGNMSKNFSHIVNKIPTDLNVNGTELPWAI